MGARRRAVAAAGSGQRGQCDICGATHSKPHASGAPLDQATDVSFSLSIFPAAVGQQALTLIFLGANDSALQSLNQRQHVPLAEYESNLVALGRAIKEQHPESRLLVLTPPPVDETAWLARLRLYAPGARESDRTLATTAAYAAAALAAARALGAPALDLFGGMSAVGSWRSLLSDGLHLTKEGNAFVAQRVVAAIEESWPELAVSTTADDGTTGSSRSSSDELRPHLPWHDVAADVYGVGASAI